MIVQEILNTTAVRSVEEQILSLYHETERNHWYNQENKKAAHLFAVTNAAALQSGYMLFQYVDF